MMTAQEYAAVLTRKTGMIQHIVVGRGNRRLKLDLPRNRDERIQIGNRIKEHLFTSARSFKDAKARGKAAMAASKAVTA